MLLSLLKLIGTIVLGAATLLLFVMSPVLFGYLADWIARL